MLKKKKTEKGCIKENKPQEKKKTIYIIGSFQ